MSKKNKLIAAAVATSMIAVGASVATDAMAKKHDGQKCYGVVKAGKNDCGAPGHACAGQSKISGSNKEWIMLPKGVCTRLVGGSLVSGKGGSKAADS